MSAALATPRRRLCLALLLATVISLAASHPAMAAAGGGSSGFGGGGGGGGRGAGLYILIQVLIRLAILGHGVGALLLIAIIVAVVLVTRVGPGAQRAWSEHRRGGPALRRRVARRSRRVELAAAEAAQDDSAFAPERVRASAQALFADIQEAWTAGDRRRLARMVGPRLMAEWERRLDDFARRGWHNVVEPVHTVDARYVGLSRRGAQGNDHVVVRVSTTVRDYVVDRHGHRLTRAGRLSQTVRVREFWTLQRDAASPHGWVVVSVQQGGEGRHALEEAIVATPAADTESLRDEALVEAAAADALPAGHNLAELADLSFAGDARAAALDLSLVDGRFAPDLLEVSVRRAVRAWAQAIDGDERDLRTLATRPVMDALLHPGDPSRATRLVIRGPRVRGLRIVGLQADAQPPAMTVEVTVEGRRYVEDRATAAVVFGDPVRPVTVSEHWTFALRDDDASPWQLVAAGAAVPARR